MSIRERKTVFGEAADEYDRIRPGYPAQLADDLLALAGPGPVLEIGAGTGKATRRFSRTGLDLTCIEPDGRMASVLRRRVPDVSVVVAPFESWRADREYGLIFCAQAWHWLDPARRADAVLAALAPGGLIAPFWNVFFVADENVHAALAEVDARHRLADQTAHRLAARDRTEFTDFDTDWPDLGLDAERFTDRESRRYEYTLSYPAERYRDYLMSTSLYRLLEPAAARAAVDDTAEVIEGFGGTIDFQITTDVALARRPD